MSVTLISQNFGNLSVRWASAMYIGILCPWRICFGAVFIAISVIMIMAIFLEMTRIKDDILFQTLILDMIFNCIN